MKNAYTTTPFPVEKIKQINVFKDEDTLLEIGQDSPDATPLKKVSDVYGDVYFPRAPEDRPYTFSSIVVSVDGKIAFEDDPQGPLVASQNLRDPDGGSSDFWVLNMLRSHADGVIVGARTMQTEPTMTAECFDEDLASQRVSHMKKKNRVPIHIIISFDGTDIPFGHYLFGMDAPVLIATSPAGRDYVMENIPDKAVDLGSYSSCDEVSDQAVSQFAEANHDDIYVLGTGSESNSDAKTLLYFLRKARLTRLLIEAPSYMTHLISIGAMDEMFMNYSTVFVGGSIGFGTYQSFGSTDHPHSDFLQINRHSKNFIFTRQKLVYDA